MLTDIAQQKKAFKDRSVKIGIIGLGYVGLPLCLSFVSNRFETIGFDVDKEKIDALKNGKSYLSHITADVISQAITSGLFSPTDDFSKISDVGVVIICVPTPLNNNQEPDLQYIISTGKLIAPNLQNNQLIVLESTTYPGTTDEVLKPILKQDRFKYGENLFLAYSPEREDPGNLNYKTGSIPKIVGGDDPLARELACAIYDQIFSKTIPVSSMKTAEAVKLTENIFRSVNIAMINELKVIYSKMGVDIWEVVNAAKSKPFGYMPFYPGPGLGGHCIPIDPYYLTYRAKQFGEDTRFIKLAGEINNSMPKMIVAALIQALKEKQNKNINGSNILLIGIAYKKNINDTRESPAFMLMKLIEEAGATASYFDPFIPAITKTRNHQNLTGRKSINWSKEELSRYDATLICTNHDNINYEELVENSKLVVDTRNATRLIKDNSKKIVKA